MATAGIKIWSPDGKLLVGPDTSIGAIIGAVNTNGTNGSITDSRFSLGIPRVFSAIPVGSTTYFWPPIITFSGNTMSWTYQESSPHNPNLRIIYGFS